MDPTDEDVFPPSTTDINTYTAAELLRNLWDVFYSWEQKYCADSLLPSLRSYPQLAPPALPAPTIDASSATVSDAESLEEGHWEIDDTTFDGAVRVPCTPISVQQQSSSIGAGPSQTGRAVQVLKLEPYPAYTSCTPASRNVLVADQRHLRAPFCPLADDPAFALIKYLRDFEDFAWQHDYEDPDYEIILAEWARMLYFTPGERAQYLPLDEVESLLRDLTGIELRLSSNDGLIWGMSQRDYPIGAWSRSTTDAFPAFYPHLQTLEHTRGVKARAASPHEDPNADAPPPPDAPDDTLPAHIHKDTPHCCASTSCMLVRCAHVADPRPLVPHRGALAWAEHRRFWASNPTSPSSTLEAHRAQGKKSRRRAQKGAVPDIMARQQKEYAKWETRSTPCSAECWLSVQDTLIDGRAGLLKLTKNWDAQETAEIHALMKLAGAEGGPCDWAVICRKPCAELYAERAAVYPTDPVGDGEADQMDIDAPTIAPALAALARNASITKFIEDRDPSNGNEVEDARESLAHPCSHTGPCSLRTGCSCFHNGQRCTRSCRCLKTCSLRYTGCNCTHRKASCQDAKKCRCKQIGRECDPELCRGCGKSSTSCQNTGVQKRKFRELQIKKGKSGLGAFALDTIPVESLIGEYVGELMEDKQGSYLTDIQNHIHLNYTFLLSKERTNPARAELNIDSWVVGNETRYLNHSNFPNCDAVYRYVDGEYKIVIKAIRKIRRGEELTLHYGSQYWKDGAPPIEDNELVDTRQVGELITPGEQGHRHGDTGATASEFEMAQLSPAGSDTTLEYMDVDDEGID